MYQCLKSSLTPPYLHDLFHPIHRQHQHHTWLSNNGVLIPKAHTNMMSRSFRYTGAVMWNALPDNIKAINREHLQKCSKGVFNSNSLYILYFFVLLIFFIVA